MTDDAKPPVSAKRTPWYPGDVKPVRSGWYERRLFGYPPVMYWFDAHRRRWHLARDWCLSAHQTGKHYLWRGLTEKQ